MRTSTQRGGGNIGCVVGIVLLVVAVVIAMKVIPSRVAVAEMEDFCERQAEQASLPRFTDDAIRENLLKKAKELNLPIDTEAIHVSRGQERVKIEVKYRVVLNLLVTNYDWDVEHKIDRTLF
jgi:hypothetical protein